MPTSEVVAAGAVVTRKGGEVLLVHRPRYDDWSFPKGKLDPGEHACAAAVREVAEETGVVVRLGPPLPAQRYPVTGGRGKLVHYWTGRATGDDDVSSYAPNDEIDEVVWVPWAEADRRLSYSRDRRTLRDAGPLRRRTEALVVLRHGQAFPRRQWRGDDRLRPLAEAGQGEALRLPAVLAAYGVQRVVTSSSTRCVQSVAPYAGQAGLPLDLRDQLSEEHATPEAVAEIVAELLDQRACAVLCSHRPVLPAVLEAAGVAPAKLEPGGAVVVHHRKGRVVATELHPAP